MILVDTSIWIDHFRAADDTLARLLRANQILSHPWVRGELALGNLRGRETTQEILRRLRQAALATSAEVSSLIDERRLWGRGIGYVDAQLLASALITPCQLWTRDQRLARAGAELGVARNPGAR